MRWIATNLESVRVRAVVALCTALPLGGCQLAQNPFRDELAKAPPIVTPSVVAIDKADETPVYRVRPFEASEVAFADDAVSHFPLFFEDVWDVVADDDGHFAWTLADWARWPVWSARFFVNLAGFPLSCIKTPPWAAMESNGRAGNRCVLGQTYDAQLR